jgi:hypothetical protein
MDREREKIILKTEDIEVTPREVVIGSKAYEISTIESVNLDERNMGPGRGNAVRIVSFLSFLASGYSFLPGNVCHPLPSGAGFLF